MHSEGQEPEAARWSPQDTGGWYAARDAVVALRDVLVAAGLARHLPYLRADLNAFGQGIVEIGRTTPEGARRIAELLALGLSVPIGVDVPGLGPEPDKDASERGMA